MRVSIVWTMREEIWLRRKARLRKETLTKMKLRIWRIRKKAWLGDKSWVWWEDWLWGEGGQGGRKEILLRQEAWLGRCGKKTWLWN